jgi:hypothetical protein
MGIKNKYRDSWKERQITDDEKRSKEELENVLEEFDWNDYKKEIFLPGKND